jgi:hypothetical protein
MTLPSLEVRIAASSDDAEEKSSGSVSLASSDLELVYDGSNQTVGMRFVGVSIPQGATIVNAYVQFLVNEVVSTATALTIQGQAIDNAPQFVATTGNISSRTRTAASVPWSPVVWPVVGAAGPDQRTPDLTRIIQEIVNRTGWSAGNSLVIIIAGTGERVAEAYDRQTGGAPLLHVEYTEGGVPATNTPTSTATATDTPTPVDTPAATSSLTPDPTLTPTATFTPTPTASPTLALTLTPTPTDTAPATFTPTATPSSTPTLSPVTSIDFISWGDAQDSGATLPATSNQAFTFNPAFTIFNGDFEYSGFQLAEMNLMVNALNGDETGNTSNGMFNKTFLVRGNHDNELASPADWQNYLVQANRPPVSGVTNYVGMEANTDYLSYSFDHGNARFIGVDVPGSVSVLATAQITWIDEMLTEAETNHPELVHAFVFFHGPIYCIGYHCACSIANDPACIPSSAASLISVFNRHPIVSATFHGHEHNLAWTHIDCERIDGVSREFAIYHQSFRRHLS